MERTRYLVRGKLMIIRPNGRHWRGLWNEPGDRHGLRRTWLFGEEDPRPHLQKIQLKRKPGPVQVCCNQEGKDQLWAMCAATGETQRALMDRLARAEEARLAAKYVEPIQRMRSVGIDSKLSFEVWQETAERLECCAAQTQERLGHLVVRLLGQEWQRCAQYIVGWR